MHGGALHFGCTLSFLLNFESPSSLPCSRCSSSLLSLLCRPFVSLSFFRFRSKRIACCLRVVGSIRSLKRGHVFEGMWFALFEGIFLFNNNYVGSGFQAEWFFIPVFILFFYRLFLFSFLLAPLRDTRSSIGELQKRKSWEIQSWIGG